MRTREELRNVAIDPVLGSAGETEIDVGEGAWEGECQWNPMLLGLWTTPRFGKEAKDDAWWA